MNFKGYLYNITHSDGSTCRVDLITDSPVYAAHFPGMPVTPGVCLIDMIRSCAEIIVGRALRLIGASNIKYSGIVDPRVTPSVNVAFRKIDVTDDEVHVSASIADGETVLTKATLTLK